MHMTDNPTVSTTIRARVSWLDAMGRLARALGVSRSVAIQVAPHLRDSVRARCGLSKARVDELLDDLLEDPAD